jgi:hypothetical protein
MDLKIPIKTNVIISGSCRSVIEMPNPTKRIL